MGAMKQGIFRQRSVTLVPGAAPSTPSQLPLDEGVLAEDREFWARLGEKLCGDLLQSVIDYLPADQSNPSISAKVQTRL